ncbi:MAG: hypothetical protein WBG46_00625 [Nonlabens sp.]
MYLYVFFFSKESLDYTFEQSIEKCFLGGIIALGAMLNLFLFFLFLTKKIGKFQKKPQYYEARGVLLATVVAALAVLYFEF